MRDKVTRQSPQTPTFEAKGEPKQIQTEVPLLTSLTPYRWAKPAHACSPQSCLLNTHSYNYPPTLCCPIKISVLFNLWCVSAPCSSRSNLHLTHATFNKPEISAYLNSYGSHLLLPRGAARSAKVFRGTQAP